MRRQAELSDSVLKKQDLQLRMWQWRQLLQVRLKEDFALLVKEEAGEFHSLEPRYLAQPLPTGTGLKAGKKWRQLGPFLSLIKPEKLSLIAMASPCSHSSICVSVLARLGSSVGRQTRISP